LATDWHRLAAMLVRAALIASAVLLSVAALPQEPPPAKFDSLLEGKGAATLSIEAPLQQLFETGLEDENVTVPATVRFKDPSSGADVALTGVAVSVRGHTSRRETECTFPKLKLKLKGAGSLKIGSHCGESADDELSPKYGRLANQKSPLREALVYELLRAVEAPTLRTRPARITYIDKAQPQPLERNALLLEDDDDAMARVGGTAEIPLETFGSVAVRGAEADAARIAFAQAMIGNFDWCLKFSPDDIYRCNEPKPLWNVLAFDHGGGRTSLLMKDFDLAGIVVGRHPWFDKVWNPAFVPSRSPIEIEVLSQVQRTRSLFPRARLDEERRHFLGRKSAVDAALSASGVDDKGREIARAYLDAFYAAIGDDAQFYRPIVVREDVRVFLDAEGTREACGPKDVMRSGTPVNEIAREGTMSQVVILDAMWRWGSRNECNAVQDGPVWIRADAIVRNFPPR
jgi:hypothetical protein